MFGQKNTNDLITLLITKVEDYSQNMANRVKGNSIFSEFDEKTRKQFNEFIKLSQMRFKGVKSGNDLQSILANQQIHYNSISDKITKDNFYKTNEIDKEKIKLLQKTEIKKTIEINQLRTKIKQDTKNFSKYELKVRERLLKRAEKKKTKLYHQSQSRLAYNYQPKFSFDKKQSDKEPVVSEEEQLEKNETDQSNSIDERKQYFEELIHEDENKLKSSIDNYNDYLVNVKSSNDNGRTMKLNHKFNFLTEDINMLSYKEEDNIPKEIKKKENQAIDIVKLMRYTKRGRSSKWLNQSKTTMSQPASTLIGYNTIIEKACSAFKSTRMTVKSEAQKATNINEEFSKKRETLLNYYKHFDLPNTAEYEEQLRIKSGIPKVNRGNTLLGSIKDQTLPITQCKRNIKSSLRRTYVDKTKLWRLQEEENELKKAKENERKKDISQFLKSVKNMQRQPQYYIDAYSKHDGKTNQRIVHVNQSFGKSFNRKKAIEKKVLKYDNHMSLIKNYNSNAQKKQKKKNDNSELAKGEEVSRKIRENMKHEDLPEDVDITYKVFAQKIEGRSNKQADNPYEEFLIFKSKIAEREHKDNTGMILPVQNIKTTKPVPPIDSLLSQEKKLTINSSFGESVNKQINGDNNTANQDIKYINVEKVKESLSL